jgi:hypothetical protein
MRDVCAHGVCACVCAAWALCSLLLVGTGGMSRGCGSRLALVRGPRSRSGSQQQQQQQPATQLTCHTPHHTRLLTSMHLCSSAQCVLRTVRVPVPPPVYLPPPASLARLLPGSAQRRRLVVGVWAEEADAAPGASNKDLQANALTCKGTHTQVCMCFDSPLSPCSPFNQWPLRRCAPRPSAFPLTFSRELAPVQHQAANKNNRVSPLLAPVWWRSR